MTNETDGGDATKPDDGDAAAKSPTAGTLDGDGRDADSGEPDYKQLYLASKDKVEAANRMERELAELRARPEAEPDDDGDDEDESDPLTLTKADLARVQDFATRGDPVAKMQLRNHYMQLELAKNVRDSFQLRDIDDKDERKEVLAHFAKHKRRLGDIAAARAEVRAPKLEAENARLKKELELARKQPPTDVVRTHSREVSSTEAKARIMTQREFDQEQAALNRTDPSGRLAREKQSELMAGKIDFSD